MGAISGSETNTIEKCALSELYQSTPKPLVATGQQVIKESGKKGK